MSLTSTTNPTRPTFARRVSSFLRNNLSKIKSQPMVRTRTVYFDDDSVHDDSDASSPHSAIQSQPMFRTITTYFGDIEEEEEYGDEYGDEHGDEDLVFARPAAIQFGSARRALSAHLGQYDVSVTLPVITPRAFASSHDEISPPFSRNVQSSPMIRTETIYFDDDEGSNIIRSVAMRRGGTMHLQSGEDGDSGIYTDYLSAQPSPLAWDPCHGSPASFSTISSDASHYSTSDVGPSPYLDFEQPQRELASCAAGPTSPHPASFNLPKSPLLRRFVSSVSRITKRFTSHETEPAILSPTCALDEEGHHVSML